MRQRVIIIAAAGVLLLAVVVAAVVLWIGYGDRELDNEGSLESLGNAIGDAVRTVSDTVTTSAYPARWGGGIRKLCAAAQPLFAQLFAAMEARGWHPRSNYPHREYPPGAGTYRALDFVDRDWPRNAWQQPVEPYASFYRDLGECARNVGLTWGGTWQDYAGSTSAWARAWREQQNLGDMLHVEYRPPPDGAA